MLYEVRRQAGESSERLKRKEKINLMVDFELLCLQKRLREETIADWRYVEFEGGGGERNK